MAPTDGTAIPESWWREVNARPRWSGSSLSTDANRQDNLGTDLHIPKGDFATLSPAGFSATSALASSKWSGRPSR